MWVFRVGWKGDCIIENAMKTLKDLEAENVNKTGEFGVSSYNLKSEAIKWIESGQLYENIWDADEWVKHFFNITEEDLK